MECSNYFFAKMQIYPECASTEKQKYRKKDTINTIKQICRSIDFLAAA